MLFRSEPFGRNTAPAVAIAALKALEIEDDPILLFLPTDHVIKSVDKFTESINKGIDYAKKGKIVTFGVIPDKPETGFGYIEANNPLNFMGYKAESIKRFLEKPSKFDAEKFILDRKFSWNSGMFIMKAKTAINEIKKYSPNT